jgi:type I restriction-modification system DNA methylase subunit
MTKYDNLDPRKQLEQTIAADLKAALEKRGFVVKHNGTPTKHAPPGAPDIETWTKLGHINVEVTKTTKSSAAGEMLSISDHLKKTKKFHPNQKCFVMYVSPATHYRMINAILDHNRARGGDDQKILPIDFANFELLTTRLVNAHKDLYDEPKILTLFARYNEVTDDDQVLKIIHEELFPEDLTLKKEIEEKESLKHAEIEEELFKELDRIENRLRESGIATIGNAIRNLIYLVFIKLYEEKQASQGGKNYFTPQNFLEFQQAEGQKKTKRAIHKLFEIIRDDEEFLKSGLFTKSDELAERLADDFVMEEVIKPLEKYQFYVQKIDGLGAAYEVLALRSSKDVKVGQFFTPRQVVQFMVKLAELEPTDTILDPACGTGRFLVWAMDDMLTKVAGKNAEATKKSIRFNQLFGTDNDLNVAKLAKMNMYIHGDGKANIWDEDGLLLYKTKGLDDKIDVILTNPPLGKIKFRRSEYDEAFLKRMEVIPRIQESPSDNAESGEEITGNVMKGGALFLNACAHYLKSIRDPNAQLEWRGGKLLIILDEGILNTDDYKLTRDAIRKYFYIKTVISLTTDTFVPVSKTPTKTSVVYLIKKDDPSAMQQEPIFYAHAARVGMDTKKRPCANHLMNSEERDILHNYIKFKEAVLGCYDGLVFNRKKFMQLGITSGRIEESQA